MANNINQNPPRVPLWPWGGPRSVRERLVDRTQLVRKRDLKARDAKNPPLASSALNEWILENLREAHSSEELRLPEPPIPAGHDADLQAFNDQPFLETVAGRLEGEMQTTLEHALHRLHAPADRLDRMRALLRREQQMLSLVGRLAEVRAEVARRRKEEQQEEGY